MVEAGFLGKGHCGQSDNRWEFVLSIGSQSLALGDRCDVVVTLGRHGLVCSERRGATWHLPATPTEVRDVCGAGDTVFAALGVGLVTGKPLRESCRAAMVGAGRQVGAMGVASVA